MKNLHIHLFAVVLICLAPPALAFDSKIGTTGLPTASMYSGTLLPDVQGVVSARRK